MRGFMLFSGLVRVVGGASGRRRIASRRSERSRGSR